jgi:hypothetical protein
MPERSCAYPGVMDSEDEDIEFVAGHWFSLLVQLVEHRNGRALVRLPNGTKTSVAPANLHSMIVEYSVDEAAAANEIVPGDIYEDCAYHPVLCTWREGDEVAGISLIDGSHPRSCSLAHCGVVKLDIADVHQAIERVRGRAPGEAGT